MHDGNAELPQLLKPSTHEAGEEHANDPRVRFGHLGRCAGDWREAVRLWGRSAQSVSRVGGHGGARWGRYEHLRHAKRSPDELVRCRCPPVWEGRVGEESAWWLAAERDMELAWPVLACGVDIGQHQQPCRQGVHMRWRTGRCRW